MTLRLLTPYLLTLALALPQGAHAAPAPLPANIESAQRGIERLTAHQARLERQLGDHAGRISRLKAQPANVRRNYQLERALRSSQQLAARLTELQITIRQMRSRLVEALTRASAGAPAQLQERYRTLLRQLRDMPSAHIQRLPAKVAVDALDGPRELNEKADLLSDSAQRLRKRAEQLNRQLHRLEQQLRLRRHARAAADNPFVEDTTRRMNRTATPAAGKSADTKGAEYARTAPAPAESGGAPNEGATSDAAKGSITGGQDSAPLGGAGGAAAPPSPPAVPAAPAPRVGPQGTTELQRLLDPRTLAELAAAKSKGGHPAARARALRQAREKLQALAARFAEQATRLRRKAATLKAPKRRVPPAAPSQSPATAR